MRSEQKAAAARNFVRSLDLLLQSAHVYGMDHTQSVDPFRVAWSDLQTLLAVDEQGCQLSLSGTQLLADGSTVETETSENGFVDALLAAGVASVQFTRQTSQDDLWRLARHLSIATAKAGAASDHPQPALDELISLMPASATAPLAAQEPMGDSELRAALLSPDAWRIAHQNVRQFVEGLLSSGQQDSAAAILLNYSSGVGSADAEARQQTAKGVAELAGLCARAGASVLESAIRCVGEQITWEGDAWIQEALAKAYARLTQEALAQNNPALIQTSLSRLDQASHEKPEMAEQLRPRMGVEDRLPDFIEDAIREKEVPAALTGLFRLSARPVAQLLAKRFSRCARREECQRLIELFSSIGAEAVTHLREVLRAGPPAEAAATVGLLSRFGADQVERLLLSRLPSWARAQHDAVVRQLALGGAPERGRLLARLFPMLDRMVLAEALDEISLSGDQTTATLLKKLAAGEVPQAADPFMRVKAIEGLGRLRDAKAVPLLRDVATAKQMWSWAQPEEMRVVTVQALSKIDPDWTRSFVPQSGLNLQDLALAPLEASAEAPWARQRRYARVSLPRTLSVLATTPKGNLQFETNLLSLGGGMASSGVSVAPGMSGSVQIKSGWRTLSADVLFREAPRRQTAFEIVAIGLEDRARMRRMLSTVSAV